MNKELDNRKTSIKCFSCKKPAVVRLGYVNRYYCKSCFLRLMVKRLRRELRHINGLKPHKEFFIVDNGLTSVLLFLLDRVFKGFHKAKVIKQEKLGKFYNGFEDVSYKDVNKKIGTRKDNKGIYINKEIGIKILDKAMIVLEPVTLEYYVITKLQALSKGVLWDKSFRIPVMKSFLEFEIESLCRLFNIGCSLKYFQENRDKELELFINKIQELHPNAKFSATNVFSWSDSLI